MPLARPTPGIAGGMNTFQLGSGISASAWVMRWTIAAADWLARLRSLQSLRSTTTIAWFSPRPPIIEKPVMVRTLLTSSICSSRCTARSDTSRVRSRVEPSGMSIEANTTHWSSSGRKEVWEVVNIWTVKRTASARSMNARKMREASHFASFTKMPLKEFTAQLNQASGPCLYGRDSWRSSEHSAGASVSAHSVEKQTAAESVTENCW